MKGFVAKKMPRNKKKKKNFQKMKPLSSMSVDDFMEGGFNVSDDSDDGDDAVKYSKQNVRCPAKYKKKTKSGFEKDHENDGSAEDSDDISFEDNDISDVDIGDNVTANDEDANDDGDVTTDNNENDKSIKKDNGDDGNWTSETFSHQKAVAKLQKTDPEFYKFLQENDKDIFDFEESDSDSGKEEISERGGKLHKPPNELEVDSDLSDYEEEGKKDDRRITLQMVSDWESQLPGTTYKSCVTIKQVMRAFHAVRVRISNEEDASARYVVTGGGVFNAVVRLCVVELHPALKKYLRVRTKGQVDPTKNKMQWSRIQKNLHFYLNNLLKVIGSITSTQVIAVLLKHLHQMMPYVACFPALHKRMLKILVNLWSAGEDTVRVVAFLCILRLTTHQQDKILEVVMKMMHMSYVRNCKFMSPNTLPGINFMRRSLVEIFALDFRVAYRHVFLYVRQLAIHLRNAITLHKKENVQAVYNWQYVNSLHLWTDILIAATGQIHLQSLVYPLIQVTIGTIKLIPTAQYFPLRFHCLEMLVQLSKRTFTYIPILPLIIEVLSTFDFNRPHKKVTMKPMDFTFILRVSKVQMQENGFKDVVIDKVYQLITEYLTVESNCIAFPDLVIPAILQMKRFIKTCKIINYTRKMKQLVDKIEENARMIETQRQKVSFKLNDHKAIAAWEANMKVNGTPLAIYYANWSQIHAAQQAKKITQNDKLGDFNLPVLKKRPKEGNTKSEGPVVLFPSDSEDDDLNNLKIRFGDGDGDEGEDEGEVVCGGDSKLKRGKRGGAGKGNAKKMKKSNPVDNNEINIDGSEDIVKDLKLEDLL